MTGIWIIVADSYRARFFSAESRLGPILEIKTLLQPGARLPERKLVSDSPGRDATRSERRQTMESRTSAKSQDTLEFARVVANELRQARGQNDFKRLIIVAAPAFLGELRKQLDMEIMESVVLEIDKDLSGLNSDAIRKHLPERLP